MTTVVNFDHISKIYRLGMTRTSLPTIVYNAGRKLLSSKGTKSLDQQSLVALDDVSFTLNKGDSMALIGPNGAGKTTILKILSRITKPTSGEYSVKGKLSALIELGAGFHPDLSGRENIYLNGTILGLTKEDVRRRFDEIVAFSELERFIDTPVKRYSSGMSVRLGFAVAANIDPDILLVDEVLAVGDAAFRQKCMDRIKELIENGTSIIFVSHSLWLVQAICKTGILMDKGKVVLQGDISEVVDLYDRTVNEQRARQLLQDESQSESTGADVEITNIEISGIDEPIGQDLRNDQPAEIRVYYIAYRPYNPINLVVRIIRSDGLTCCAMRTNLDGFNLNLERGAGVVSVTLDPLQLYGGSFYIQAIFRDKSDTYPLTNSSSNWFYVAGSKLSSQEMNGVFEPNRKWGHNPALPQSVKPAGSDTSQAGG